MEKPPDPREITQEDPIEIPVKVETKKAVESITEEEWAQLDKKDKDYWNN